MTSTAITQMTADDRAELVRLNNTRWWEQRACADAPVEWFIVPRDAERLSSTYREEQEAPAKALCAVCPVDVPCRRDAELTGDTEAIRGGMTFRERTQARKAAG